MTLPYSVSTLSTPIPGIPGPFAGVDPAIPISQLPQPIGPLFGGEFFPLVQNGLTCRATLVQAFGVGGQIKIPQPFATEQLTVTAPNTLSNLSFPPTTMITVYVNGLAFFGVGSTPDFSVSGTTVTWLNPFYTLEPGTRVIAQYTHA